MQSGKWVTLGFGALCLVAVAGVLNAQHLYYMAAILLTLPGVSYGMGWYALRGLEFHRELPPSSWEGEEGDIVYIVTNASRISRYFLTIREMLPEWIVLQDVEPPLFNVPAGDTARVTHRVRFAKRGVFRVQEFEVVAMDPLGVFAFTRRVPCDGELVVWPTPQQMRPQALSGAEKYGFQELTRAAMQGSSVEPDGVREYHPGDPLRRIHWRQTARTGSLSVIEFEEAQSVNLVIALDLLRDTNIGSGRDTTLEYGVRLAASLAQQAIQQGASLRLLLPEPPDPEDSLYLSAAAASFPGRGQQHLFLVLDALARVEAEARETISEVVARAAGELLPGTSLVVITSYPDRALPGILTRYSATGSSVSVVAIDPATFPRGKASVSERNAFIADLLSARVQPFSLAYDAQGLLTPEPVTSYGSALAGHARS